MKASPELFWLCGARRELCRAVAEPQGLATHLHVSFCLLKDTDCPCTPWVEPRLCWPPLRAVLPSLEPVCVCPPNRPQPRPLWLQELALPCNVLILIKVQTGFFLEVVGGLRSGMRRVLPSLTHIACPPFLLLFPPTTEDNALYRYHPHISHWGRAPSISPGERLPEDHPEPKMSFLRQRLKPSELGAASQNAQAPLVHHNLHCLASPSAALFIYYKYIFYKSQLLFLPYTSGSSFHSPCLPPLSSMGCSTDRQMDPLCQRVPGALGCGRALVGGTVWRGAGIQALSFSSLYIRMYI